MTDDKEIRFTEKKVDESWKEQATRERESQNPNQTRGTSPRPQTSKVFVNFLTSLGFQTMVHLGEMPNPQTQQKETNLEAAREVIEFLIQLKAKTQGNLSREEEKIFTEILPELQMKFAQKV